MTGRVFPAFAAQPTGLPSGLSPADRALDLALRRATVIIFAAVLLYFGLQAPAFLGQENLGNIVKQSAFIGIAAIGITFVLLTAGIDLSVGSVMYLAPLIAGFVMRDTGVGVAGGMAAAVAAGAVLGGINAIFIVGLSIIPFIVTLATLFAFRGFGAFLTSSRQFDFPPAIRDFGLAAIGGIPVPVIAFGLVALAAHLVLTRTTFGRQVYAVGNDPAGAVKAGIPVARIRGVAYVISGAAAGLAGFVLIAQIGRLDAGFGQGREFDVIAAAVLGGASLFGGVGTALGAVVGATLMQTVNTGLAFTGVNLYLQPLLQGGIIFLAVLVDSLRQARQAMRRRRTIRPLQVLSRDGST
ncbi:ABC transporter permease [Plastorhodobacter daqingensis]|uniref:Autoinducer 2 import system permease protein LsrD n=1 Tax=Plastorhodobacter daqingensis TaxID=1387281 RepID=A0ABW2UDQ7_9RHOB